MRRCRKLYFCGMHPGFPTKKKSHFALSRARMSVASLSVPCLCSLTRHQAGVPPQSISPCSVGFAGPPGSRWRKHRPVPWSHTREPAPSPEGYVFPHFQGLQWPCSFWPIISAPSFD